MDTDDDGRAAHDKKEKREKKEKKRDEGADIVEEGGWCFDDKRFKGPRAHSEFLSAVYHYLKMTHGKEALETLDFEEVQRYYDDNFSAASQLWGEDDLIDAWLLHLKKKRRKEEKKARKSADPADQSPAAADAPAAQPDADSRMSPSPPPPPPPPSREHVAAGIQKATEMIARRESEDDPLDVSATTDECGDRRTTDPVAMDPMFERAATTVVEQSDAQPSLDTTMPSLSQTLPSPRGVASPSSQTRVVTSASGASIRIGRGSGVRRKGEATPTPSATCTATDTSTSSGSEPPTPTPASVAQPLPQGSTEALPAKSRLLVKDVLSSLSSLKTQPAQPAQPSCTEPDSDVIPQKATPQNASAPSLRDLAAKLYTATDSAATGHTAATIEGTSIDITPVVATSADGDALGAFPEGCAPLQVESLQRVLLSGQRHVHYPKLATPNGIPCSGAYSVTCESLTSLRVMFACSGRFSYANHTELSFGSAIRFLAWREALPSAFLGTKTLGQLVGDGWSSRVLGASRPLSFLEVSATDGKKWTVLFSASYIACVAVISPEGDAVSHFVCPLKELLASAAPLPPKGKK